MFAALGNNFSALSEINSFKPTDAQNRMERFLNVVSWFSTKVSRPFNGESSAFSTSSARKTGYPHVKERIWVLILYTKINSKWNKELRQQNS